MKNNLKGSVSLFVAMIFLLVISVITTTLLSARIEGAKAMVSTVATLALDSVFAEYDRELYEEYGILLIDGTKGKEDIAKRITGYLEPSFEIGEGIMNFTASELLGVAIEGVSVRRITKATDGGGLFWMDEAVDYEKYAKPINLAADYLSISDSNGQIETIEKIMDKMTDITDEVSVVDNSMKNLIEYVDGVEFQHVYVTDGDYRINEYFLRKFRVDGYMYEKLYIDSIVSDYIVRIDEELDDAYFLYMGGKMDRAKEILDKFRSDIGGVLSVTETVEMKYKLVDASCNIISGMVDELGEYIDEAGNMLGKEVAESMCGDIQELKDYKSCIKEKICDIPTMLSTMEFNKGLLLECQAILRNIEEGNDILRLKEIMQNYRYDGYDINYDFFRKSKSGFKILDNLKKILKQGVLGITIPEGDTVSTRYVSIDDLASSVCNTDNTDELMAECQTGTRIAKNIVYGEYVMDSFYCYTDKGTGPALNYEVEYILNGKRSDVENLYETVKKLAIIRSAVNMVYLLTDSEKKEDAYGLSKTVFGWMGVEGIVKAGQYLVMYLWSYAEGLTEVKALLSGWKVLPFKNKETWHLSFEDFISLNFNPEEEKCEKGLKYEMYLRALLMFKDEGEKSAYTMDLVELWKIAKGDIKFRLRNYVFAIEAEIMYSVSGFNRKYNYLVAESY